MKQRQRVGINSVTTLYKPSSVNGTSSIISYSIHFLPYLLELLQVPEIVCDYNEDKKQVVNK